MKKIVIFCTFLLLILLTGCVLPLRFTEVRGSGNLVTQTRRISGINTVDLSGIGKLIVEQGDEESLEITAEDNIIDHLVSSTSGNNLSLSVEEYVNIQPTRDIVYHLTIKDLSEIETSGLGNVEAESLQVDSLALGISGSGSVAIGKLQTDRLDMRISGSGSMDITSLDADTLNLDISGMGDVDLTGVVVDQDIEISGTGSYNAGDLFSQIADVEISGTGNAVLWTSDRLDLKLSGSGRLEYYGEPILNTEISGVGSIQSLGSK